jgi:hypothetical protein
MCLVTGERISLMHQYMQDKMLLDRLSEQSVWTICDFEILEQSLWTVCDSEILEQSVWTVCDFEILEQSLWTVCDSEVLEQSVWTVYASEVLKRSFGSLWFRDLETVCLNSLWFRGLGALRQLMSMWVCVLYYAIEKVMVQWSSTTMQHTTLVNIQSECMTHRWWPSLFEFTVDALHLVKWNGWSENIMWPHVGSTTINVDTLARLTFAGGVSSSHEKVP